ncbi:MAG TPA: hypothetical protein VN578_14900 [Candidatus Binatia bacterium]|jgi:hypothetical protein|nr:hypothetical protein [Candidatus Binatia bacterium]
MKQIPEMQSWLRSAALGLMFAGSVALGQAQTYTNVILAQFDCDGCGAIHSFSQWWGDPTWEAVWDGTQNAPTTLGPNNAGSGAMKFTVHWLPAPVQNQLCLWQEFDGTQNYWVDPSQRVSGFFYDLDFDIKFDPGSAKTAAGDYGRLQFGVAGPTFNQIWLTNFPHFNYEGWTHIHTYIDPAIVSIDQMSGFALYYPWQPGAITADQTFWIDNIIMKTNLTKPLKPPTLSLAAIKDKPGLNIAANGSGDGPRESIAAGGNHSWVYHGSQPVTYSLTITNYPGTNHPYLQTHFFLVSNPGGESAPDWNEPNCVFVQILNNADGTATGRFMYKTNQPGGNNMLWGPGTLAYVNSSNGVLGTWSLSFTDNTNITMTAPTGQSTNFFFPDDAAVQTAFADPLTVYFGQQKNGAANTGQISTYSRARITGATSPDIDDAFPGPNLNTSNWRVACDTPNDLYIIGADDAWWLTWTLPDLGFSLVTSPTLAHNSWVDPGLTNTLVVGATKKVVVPRTVLPDANHSYFKMIKRVATKLQVLMPGETNAPGTLTGKIGTPDVQPISTVAYVTINAVDDSWTIVKSVTDQVQLTGCTDISAYLYPSAVALVNGTTSTPYVLFQTAPGSFTVTASDVTNPSVAAGTSAATTVTP